MIQRLTYTEYITFLLLYAAYSDLTLSKAEITEIIESMGNEGFGKMKDYILSLNDYEQIQIIETYKKEYLDTPGKVEEALNEICQVLMSEQKFGPVQQFYYNFLQKELRIDDSTLQ